MQYAVEDVDMEGWDYAVVDTTKPEDDSIVCLCCEKEEADKIAALLNKA
jgi:hypothetical protein